MNRNVKLSIATLLLISTNIYAADPLGTGNSVGWIETTGTSNTAQDQYTVITIDTSGNMAGVNNLSVNSISGLSSLSATGQITSGSLSTGSITSTSIDNQNGGITNAGAISGVSTISASSTISTSGNMSAGGTLNITGTSTLGALDQIGTTNINTTGTASTTIGNSNTSSTTTINAGDSTISASDGVTRMYSGSVSTSGFSAYSATQTIGTDYTLQNGDTNTQTLITGKTVNNIIVGDTLVDGNMYINGSLSYSSNTSADTTVSSGTSSLSGASTTTSGSMNISNSGGATVDVNGKIYESGAASPTASLTLTNGYDNTHGIVITESQTTISGGEHSTSMTLDDNGATFTDSQTGAPVQLHGVADGTSTFDAVNYGQLQNVAKKAYSGIAGIAAMTQLPTPQTGKNFSFGIGSGFYEGEHAFAIGLKSKYDNVTFSLAGSLNSQHSHSVAAGFGWSF